MSKPPDSRTVRVFLSSTFRDFAEERDLLIKKAFPELRRKCRERQVELVDVDLRWGITEKEAQQGKVLPICLAEIDRSRPYFMGFIGERYGWVPEKDQYDLSLILEQPWLDKHRGGKSVTELEMLHGVLNNPAMEDRAFFYFRDATYSQKKGGHYLSESPEDKAKLEALKDRIRKSGFPVVENYKNPEALAERVKDDLWKLIDEAYPESEAPDALTQERMRHEAYSSTRRRLYLGGERYYKTLSLAMKAKPFRSVLITGQSGGGKSALLSNWVTEWSKRNKKAAVIMHHLGCGADAADPVQMATRLMKEIARLTDNEFKPESDPDKTLEKLPEWLAMASAWAQRSKKELLIVLDGLDKLSDRQHLRWFPSFLPPRVKLVASCLHGHILDAAKARLNWLELKVRPFTKTQQKEFIGKYLGRYRKSLTTRQTRTLQGHSLSGNPLFLLTVLEELRVFGVHEKLETRLGELLSPPLSKAQDEEPTVDDVFEHVLARIEEDLGRKPVQAAMEAIWASRAGLYQDELLGIAKTAKLTPAKWAVIQNALDESLYETNGKINFGHDYLRKAVEDRYLSSPHRMHAVHLRLAKYFTDIARDENGKWKRQERRAMMENIHHFIKASALREVEEILTDFSYLVEKLRSDCVGRIGYEYGALDSLRSDCRSLLENGKTKKNSLLYWVNFLQRNFHALQRGSVRWPSYKILLQLAIEDADTSPVTRASEAWLKEGNCDWLWLRRDDRPRERVDKPKVKVMETPVLGVAQPSPEMLFSWDDKDIKLWDLETEKGKVVGRAPKTAFMSLDGAELVAVFDDGLAWLDITSGSIIKKVRYRGGNLDGGMLLKSGEVLTWSDKDKKSQIWNRSGMVGSWRELWMPETCKDVDLIWFRGYLSLDKNHLLFWGDQSGFLRVWDVTKGKIINQWRPGTLPQGSDSDATFSVHLLGSGDILTEEVFEGYSETKLWSGRTYKQLHSHRINLDYSVIVPLNKNRIAILSHFLNEKKSRKQSYIYDFNAPKKRKGLKVSNVLGARLLQNGSLFCWTLEGKRDMGHADLHFFNTEGTPLGSYRKAHNPISHLNVDDGLMVIDSPSAKCLSYSSVDKTIKQWSGLGNAIEKTNDARWRAKKINPSIYEEADLMMHHSRPRSMFAFMDGGFQLQWTPSLDKPFTGVVNVKAPNGHAFNEHQVEALDLFEVSSLQLLWNGVQLSCYTEFCDGRYYRDLNFRIIDAFQKCNQATMPVNASQVCCTRLESGGNFVDLFADWASADQHALSEGIPYPLPSARWEADVAYRLRWIDGDGCIVLESFSGEWIRLKAYIGERLLDRSELVHLRTTLSEEMLYKLVGSRDAKIKDILDTLTEREREVLEQRFGLEDGYSRTLEEVGHQFQVTRERMLQVEAKALRKMRHPTRIRKLEGFIKLPDSDQQRKQNKKPPIKFTSDESNKITKSLAELIAENLDDSN